MKTKALSKALLILLSLTAALSLFSCDVTDTEDSTDPTISETESSAPESDLPDPKLPDASKSIVTGDGSTVLFSSGVTDNDFLASLSYFYSEGFEEYSKDTIGGSQRATFIKGDEYYTVVYSSSLGEFTMIHSESGAKALPKQSDPNAEFEKLCDTTITQNFSKDASGMGYIFRLEDGSFIVYDGGYKTNAKDLLINLTKLCLTDKIHVRAWIITHDHSDHYAAFNEIANTSSYAKRLKIDYVMYSPVTKDEANVVNYYAEKLHADIEKFKGAVLLPVHAGMTFNILNVKLEILQTPAMLSVHNKITDFNDTSIISRIVSQDGSAIMLADACGRSADWLVANIGDGLKSDIVQVAHHGVETGSIPLYDAIAAPMVFWPCNDELLASHRGEKIKQHIIEADYSVEHVLHSYGTVTRSLSYRPTSPEMKDVMPTDNGKLSVDPNGYAQNARVEDGVLRFDIAAPTDPFIVINYESGALDGKNAIKMVVDSEDAKDGWVFFQTFYESDFSEKNAVYIGNQGTSADGKTTYLIYFGNAVNVEDGIEAIRIDFGSEVGQTVEIYSIEAFYLDLSAK